jgi:hypothetical protein
MTKRLKMIILLASVLGLASRVYPQEYRLFSIMGGLTCSWADEISIGGIPENRWEKRFRLGAAAGCGVGYYSRYLGIEINALLVQKGCRVATYYWNDFLGYTHYKLDEISLPLLFKLSLFSGTSPYFIGGYELAFVLSHKESGPGGYRRDLTKQTKKTDNSLIVGMGFRKKVPKGFAFIEARYHLGLQRLSKDWDFWHFPYRQLRSFVLLVGFSF